jgi:hypothetical protein
MPARNNRGGVTICDAYSRCYVEPAGNNSGGVTVRDAYSRCYVEPSRNNSGRVTIRDAYSRCYVHVEPGAYACAVTSGNNKRGHACGVLCGSVPRLPDSTDCVLFRELMVQL